MLALFGLDVDAATASRQAMRAAANIAANVEHMNYQFTNELRDPIQFGIGIHGGDVIIGDIGFRDHTVFTALGDPVNVAARLQDMTKSLNCQVVISDETFKTSGVATDGLPLTQVAIRGREEQIGVRTATDATVLAGLLDGQAVAPAA
jgi:adenylate cyclase